MQSSPRSLCPPLADTHASPSSLISVLCDTCARCYLSACCVFCALFFRLIVRRGGGSSSARMVLPYNDSHGPTLSRHGGTVHTVDVVHRPEQVCTKVPFTCAGRASVSSPYAPLHMICISILRALSVLKRSSSSVHPARQTTAGPSYCMSKHGSNT